MTHGPDVCDKDKKGLVLTKNNAPSGISGPTLQGVDGFCVVVSNVSTGSCVVGKRYMSRTFRLGHELKPAPKCENCYLLIQ
jgi:hypothetical protein